MSALLEIVVQHNHECSRKGQMLTLRPRCEDGVAFTVVPVCIETGSELQVIDRVVTS